MTFCHYSHFMLYNFNSTLLSAAFAVKYLFYHVLSSVLSCMVEITKMAMLITIGTFVADVIFLILEILFLTGSFQQSILIFCILLIGA